MNSVKTAATPTALATATAPSPVLRLNFMFCPMTLSHACTRVVVGGGGVCVVCVDVCVCGGRGGERGK